MKSEIVEKYWRQFCETSDVNPEKPFQVWFFGNSFHVGASLPN